MSLDLTARPGAAPLLRRWLAQAGMEWRALMTNGEQLLLTLVIPVAVLVAVVRVGLSAVAAAMPGVLTLAVLSSAFTATAIATGFERRSGVLKLLGATPLSRSGLLVGKTAATLAVIAGQWLLVAVTGALLGWQATGNLAALGACAALGTAALGTWGFALAGLVRAEATLALANAIFLILLFAGGTALPTDRLPGPVRAVVELLPTAALSAALRGVMGLAATGWQPVLILLGWAGAGALVAARTFRWE